MTPTTEQKQQAIRARIEAMRESDPNISFRAAWRRLRKERPQLFDSDRPIDSSSPQDNEQKDLRSAVLKTLIQKVKALRRQFPDANTQTIFAHLRSREPDLMIQASEAERPEPIRITRKPPGDDDEAFIMLIAEDADQLLAQCDAGMWDSD
jgi:hypothetical protein